MPGVAGRISWRPVARTTFLLMYCWPLESVVMNEVPFSIGMIDVTVPFCMVAVGYLLIPSRAAALNAAGAVS